MGDENIEKQNVIEEEGISLNDPNHSGFLRYIVESKQEIEQVHEIELEPETEQDFENKEVIEQDFENKEDSEFIMTKKADIVGGITVGVMHVPQGIAYALLSGVKPINGLYMSFFAPLFYMFFGTSRHMSLGVFHYSGAEFG
uniref:SLC26A/SulP transporter domain-containing protein n=1 Tax=Panagrolaimus sp. JU765 TaxID=591449 RepID=A0AC34R8Q2_9BILA